MSNSQLIKEDGNVCLDVISLPTAMATAYGSRAASSDTMANACLTPTESAQAILNTKKHIYTYTWPRDLFRFYTQTCQD